VFVCVRAYVCVCVHVCACEHACVYRDHVTTHLARDNMYHAQFVTRNVSKAPPKRQPLSGYE